MTRSYTKKEQVLEFHSDWNQAKDNEPIFVVRANNWRALIFLAALVKNDAATEMCLNVAERMKAWDADEDDKIPF
jgi:hypothetical protein